MDLTVKLGRLQLANPIMVASGTFGYAREMAGLVDLSKLGAVVPKTITRDPRIGNSPWRTVEVSSGLLNSIGLDNDGIDYFLSYHWPYLKTLPTTVIVSLAGKSREEFVELAKRMSEADGLQGIELNISCPNVSGGVDFGTDPKLCFEVVKSVRQVTEIPILAKLTPNVANIVEIARAAQEAGADAVCCINTLLGMAIDWRRRKPLLGNIVGGMSGPAVKPVALRCVYQIASKLDVPIVGIGGIATMDDVMEFLVAGASAVQIGTANYYDPKVSQRMVEQLPGVLREIGANSLTEVIGSLSVLPRNAL